VSYDHGDPDVVTSLLTRRYVVRSAAAGAYWGAVAWLAGWNAFPGEIRYAVAVCPFIGLLVGVLSVRLKEAAAIRQVATAGLSLFGGGALFGAVLGVIRLVTRPSMNPIATVSSSILAVLWGLTIAGYALVLWPLALATHHWVWAAAPVERDA
jgi:hypothetical protein